MHEVIKRQGDAIRDLEQRLESKASKADVSTALTKKSNVADVNRSIVELSLALDSKASLSDLDSKADKSDIAAALKQRATSSDLRAATDGKASVEDLLAFRAQYERHMEFLQDEVAKKASRDELHAATVPLAVARDVDERLLAKADRVAVEEALQAKASHKVGWRGLLTLIDLPLACADAMRR